MIRQLIRSVLSPGQRQWLKARLVRSDLPAPATLFGTNKWGVHWYAALFCGNGCRIDCEAVGLVRHFRACSPESGPAEMGSLGRMTLGLTHLEGDGTAMQSRDCFAKPTAS